MIRRHSKLMVAILVILGLLLVGGALKTFADRSRDNRRQELTEARKDVVFKVLAETHQECRLSADLDQETGTPLSEDYSCLPKQESPRRLLIDVGFGSSDEIGRFQPFFCRVANRGNLLTDLQLSLIIANDDLTSNGNFVLFVFSEGDVITQASEIQISSEIIAEKLKGAGLDVVNQPISDYCQSPRS